MLSNIIMTLHKKVTLSKMSWNINLWSWDHLVLDWSCMRGYAPWYLHFECLSFELHV